MRLCARVWGKEHLPDKDIDSLPDYIFRIQPLFHPVEGGFHEIHHDLELLLLHSDRPLIPIFLYNILIGRSLGPLQKKAPHLFMV